PAGSADRARRGPPPQSVPSLSLLDDDSDKIARVQGGVPFGAVQAGQGQLPGQAAVGHQGAAPGQPLLFQGRQHGGQPAGALHQDLGPRLAQGGGQVLFLGGRVNVQGGVDAG